MKHSSIFYAAMAVSALFGVTGAEAQSGLLAGTLTCQTQGTVGLIVGSKENIDCEFKHANGGDIDLYSGSITKVGVDVGFKGKGTLVWGVLSSTSDVPRNALAGSYGGVSADAAIGVGGGANVLVGGSDSAFTLQPLSVEGSTGLNLAVGAANLQLWAQDN